MKHVIALSCYLLIQTGFAHALPPNIKTGVKYGVISSRADSNTLGTRILSQGGSAWDALIAIVTDLLVEAPHIASFNSDMTVMVIPQHKPPRSYWLSQNPDAKKTYPYSTWADTLINLHKRNVTKFTPERLMSSATHKLTTLSSITFPKGTPHYQRLVNPKTRTALKKWLLHLSRYQPLLSKKTLALRRKQTKQTLSLPNSSRASTFRGSIPLENKTQLFSNTRALLTPLHAKIKTLPTQKITPAALAKYLKGPKIANTAAHYRYTFQLVLFDAYGTIVMVHMGIPDLSKALFDPVTACLNHTSRASFDNRKQELGVFALWHPKRHVLWAITPKYRSVTPLLWTLPLRIIESKSVPFSKQVDAPHYEPKSSNLLHTSGAVSPDLFKHFKRIRKKTPPITWFGVESHPNHAIGFASPWAHAYPSMQ